MMTSNLGGYSLAHNNLSSILGRGVYVPTSRIAELSGRAVALPCVCEFKGQLVLRP